MEVNLLVAFLRAQLDGVDLHALGEEAGVGEQSLEATITQLKHVGFVFEKVDAIHVRLSKQPSTIYAPLIEAHLHLAGVFTHLEYFSEIDSTNSEAERLLAKGEPSPLVVIASKQDAGRGRMRREWFSEDLGNIYMTFGFEPRLSPERMKHFTLWQGMTLCDTLNESFGLSLKVKWPNDLVHEGKKIAGMLTEAKVDASLTRTVIFGIGLNVNSQIDQWPEELQRTASCLANIAGHPLNINAVAAKLIEAGIAGYERYVSGDYEHTFATQWEIYDALKGNVITISAADGHHTGRSLGIDPEGTLKVELEDGSLRSFQAGDVTLHKTYQAGQS